MWALSNTLFNLQVKLNDQFIINSEVKYLVGNKFSEFKSQLSDINQSINMCIFLLSGPKKNGQNYKEIKQFLSEEKGVACQCVCIKTLQGKSTRSIVSKILT